MHLCMHTLQPTIYGYGRPPLAFAMAERFLAETSVAEILGPKRPRPKCPWPKCPTFSYLLLKIKKNPLVNLLMWVKLVMEQQIVTETFIIVI